MDAQADRFQSTASAAKLPRQMHMEAAMVAAKAAGEPLQVGQRVVIAAATAGCRLTADIEPVAVVDQVAERRERNE